MVVGLIIWLVLCFVVAAGAKNRGRSYIGFLLLSLFLSPLVGAFTLFVLGEKRVEYYAPQEVSAYDTPSESSVYSSTMLDRLANSNNDGTVLETWTCKKCGCSSNPLSNTTCKDCGEYK